MSMPPPPPGQSGPGPHHQPGPYGQQPPPPGYGQGGYGPGGPGQGGPGQPGSPYSPPPEKGGVPTWAWIVGGVVALILLCGCGVVGLGFAGLFGISGDDETTQGPPETTTSESTEPTTDEPTTDQPTTDEPTSDEPTTDEPTTDQPSTTPTVPSSSVPPTPDGTKLNTDSRNKLPSGDVEKQIAKGMSGLWYTKSDIACPDDLVLVKGKTTTCTAPALGDSSNDADVEVEVAWAVVDSNNRISYYLSFEQQMN